MYTLDAALRAAVDEGRVDTHFVEDAYIEFLDYLRQQYGTGELDHPLPANEALIFLYLRLAYEGEAPEEMIHAAAVAFELPHWDWALLSVEQLREQWKDRFWQYRRGGVFFSHLMDCLEKSDEWVTEVLAEWRRTPGGGKASFDHLLFNIGAETRVAVIQLPGELHVSPHVHCPVAPPAGTDLYYEVEEGPGRYCGSTGWYFSIAAKAKSSSEREMVNDEGPYIDELSAMSGVRRYIEQSCPEAQLTPALRDAPAPWLDVEPGFVFSHNSMRLQDNLPTLLNYLEEVHPLGAMDVLGGMEPWSDDDDDPWWDTEEPWDLIEQAINAVNDAPGAPPLHYFGVSEADGTDFGWWFNEEEAEDVIRQMADVDQGHDISRGEARFTASGRWGHPVDTQEIMQSRLADGEDPEAAAINGLGIERAAEIYDETYPYMEEEDDD